MQAENGRTAARGGFCFHGSIEVERKLPAITLVNDCKSLAAKRRSRVRKDRGTILVRRYIFISPPSQVRAGKGVNS
jgi:hypothetical protein